MAKSKTGDQGYIPDEIDQKIIHYLREDGRESNASIAKRLHLTEGTIRQRIKNLIHLKVLKISGRVDPDSLVDHQMTMIGINIAKSNLLMEKAKEISELPEVLNVSIAAGRYDLLAEVLVASNRGMIDFLSKSLPKVTGIESTESFLMLKSINKWI